MERNMGSTGQTPVIVTGGRWPYRRTASREEFADVFWERVDRSGDCWTWLGRTTGKGYGQITSKWFDTEAAHRIAYELECGPIPAGMHVLHLCDNPPCVKPAHLFLGTNHDNILDMLAKGRQSRVGSKNPHAKLTEAQVIEIRRAIANGEPYKSIGQRYGLSANPIRDIAIGRTWTHVRAA